MTIHLRNRPQFDSWSVPRQVCQARHQHIRGKNKIRPMEYPREGWAIGFATALAGFALRPLRCLRRSGAHRYRGGI